MGWPIKERALESLKGPQLTPGAVWSSAQWLWAQDLQGLPHTPVRWQWLKSTQQMSEKYGSTEVHHPVSPSLPFTWFFSRIQITFLTFALYDRKLKKKSSGKNCALCAGLMGSDLRLNLIWKNRKVLLCYYHLCWCIWYWAASGGWANRSRRLRETS